MEHVKVHYKKINPGTDYLQRQAHQLNVNDERFAVDICEPIYQQLFFRQKNAYWMFAEAIKLHGLTADQSYFSRGLDYIDLAVHTAETLMQGMLNRSGEPIVVTHQSQQLSLPYWQLNKRIGWLDWSNYLCQAISRRAHSSVDLLMKFTPQMAAEYTSEPREYTAFYVRYLQGMLDPAADHDALQQEFTEVHAREFHLRFRAALAPFYCLAKEDEAGFEAAILHGSKIHRAYVKKVSNKMDMDPLGFYPPQLIAAASLAYDRHGWRLQHKNDYLPEWWIYNTFTAPELAEKG
ncbi:hypothetical protein Sden_0915 [Shewanella denitrificans OS217]|jgi:hypothetical protein|uniref:Uncharacterized protein n=1 Tax=Shewanella denitrificans (strain OS217 / ATCC BAA-1090 / DSM 15013) TaxID=318161 RepID=Q12QS3_SHEDO|nr:immunity 49 family protein [Shewanella denitrificans]ABE54203.1 hypothetical protein Sden_0915 [Shewanella denitrificans OS217]